MIYSNVSGLFLSKNSRGTIFVASEEIFLKSIGAKNIQQIPINEIKLFKFNRDRIEIDIVDDLSKDSVRIETNRKSLSKIDFHTAELIEKFVESRKPKARCSRCLLPQNFPKMSFDIEGVCEFCLHYRPPKVKGDQELSKRVFEKNKKGKVLVNLSGGRDSSFALIQAHNLKLKPISFTYDWGFVSTAARENMAELCGRLGCQHIVVSPNLVELRKTTKEMLNAWLKVFDPATIPMLMAGDKPLLSTSMQISREHGGLPILHGDHAMETTHFKSALAGAKYGTLSASGSVSYKVDLASLFRMAFSYFKVLLRARSRRLEILALLIKSAFIYYAPTHKFISVFDYIEWDEGKIDSELELWGWRSNQQGIGNKWRMGDSTAPLYNFLYLLTIGYTENDCLIANQIRSGKLELDKGLNRIAELNKIDFLGIESYLNLLELDSDKFWRTIQEYVAKRAGVETV
jgi:hypothetical protein